MIVRGMGYGVMGNIVDGMSWRVIMRGVRIGRVCYMWVM